MSVKVDAASDTGIAGSAAKATIERTVKESKESNNTESPTSKEEVSSTQDTTSADNKKDTVATGQDSQESAEKSSDTDAGVTPLENDGEENGPALEVSVGNGKEVLGSTEEESNDEANVDRVSSISEENVEGEDGQVEAPKTNADKASTTLGGNAEEKDRETEFTQAEDAENSEQNNEDSNLGLSDESPAEAQKAGEATTEPNYTEDEKEIKDYSGSERYRETDLQPGDTNQESDITDQGEAKDGLEFNIKNPSATSPSKTEYGYQITIDKKTGQRTYTKVYVTDSGLITVNPGEKPMMGDGEKISAESPYVTYKPDENTNISGSRTQRNLNYEASEETLKHINNKDNDFTSFGMQDNYTKENPGVKFFGDSFALGYKVNPWPNENDKLELMKLNGEYNEKVFVQGQDIDTGVKVDNIDENARERLVGQVYNPITGDIVPGASAYIDDKGSIHIQMPEGALIKNEDGKYVVNKKSIFSNGDYKALQNLDVKFFARPRTAEEFRKIAETPDDFGETGTYVETGAGTADINHKGTNVTIDKQGIDRYDHYNLIGDFKLKLDDTRYYDQDFKDQEGNKIDEHSSTKVFPGQDFSVEIQDPETAAEIDGAYSRGEASGKLKDEFLEIANKQIADDLGVDYDEFITSKDYADKRWTLVGKSDNISKFTIRAPKQAKAGDFLALPVEYTYTNGSTDTHWFHFVVQETNNNRPEYLAEVGPQGNTLVNNPIVPKKNEDLKKNQPESYELIGNTFKDNKGNVWKVSIDQKTGAVTATLPLGKEINGGEKLTVPVKVKYTDQTTGEERTEEIKAQFIATKQHKTLTNETTTSEIPFETEVVYDENLPEGHFQEFQAGQKGELKITFVQDTLNGKKGIFQQDGTFKEGESQIVVETTKEPTKRIIKIGTKPATTKVEIPFDTEYEVDNNLEAGKTELVNDGEKGEVTITTTRNEDGTITVNQNVTKEAKKKKIKIGTKTQGQLVDTDKIPFGYKVEFDPDFYKNYPDATENYKIVTPGKEGENTKTWTIVNSEKVGDPEVKITDPVDAVIKVGQKDYSGTVKNIVTKEIPYTVRVVENPELEAGKSNVKQKGVAGSKTFEYSGEIFNGALKEGSSITEKELTDKYVAPQEEIIEIGTKTANNEKTYEREVGVEVEYVYDNTKEKGYRNIEELVPGKVITKVVNKYNPETGEIETTEEIEVIPGKRKVTFGTKDFTGAYEEVDKNIVPYETEIVFDSNLKAGEKVVDQAGVNGETTTTTKKHIENGEVVRSEDPVTEETKKVQNQIIRVGTMTDGKHSYTEKLPYKYEIEYDENLEAGEYVIDVEGKEGSKTTEWTIKNSEVVEDSTSVTEHTPATNAKIRVGKKDFTGNVSHEVTEEIPYDVKVIEDPNMIAGTSEVVTEGKAGSKTTKYTQGIRNGEAEGELSSEVTSTTNPTQKVIKVGTKPAENNKDYAQDVDVKVEYEYNPNLDKGVVQVGELTKGKVETKIVNKYDPKTGEVTTTEEEIVKDATQKIIVGTKDFTGTYKYEKTCPLPFEVEIKEDPNLAKGEKIVDQKGEAGSKTTYYEQDIKNGQPNGDPKQLNEKINSQPKNHIVRIGTKVAEGSTVETVEKDIPYETKITYDENLDAGSQVVDKEGVIGKEKVTVTTNITDGNGETSKTTETIKDKEDRIVRVGVKPVVKETELGNNTEYKHNPELKVGEEKVIEEGSKGSVKYTTTFNKETGKLEVKEERVEPKNKVVEYGSKTDGEFTYESEQAYDIKVIEDPNLEAGKTVVDKEGIVGKTKTTVKVENSKKVSENTETLIEKQDKIVRVGTKNVCEIPPVKPGEDPKDPDKDPGKEDPKDPDKDPGEEDSKNPDKDPGKEDPKDPDKEPGEEDSKDPDKDPDKGDPNKPGNNTPSKPGNKDPFRPGEDKPNQPSEPSDKTPNKPEDKTPNKIVENPSEDPKDSPQESPEKPKTEDVKDIEKNSTPEETREVEKKENLEDDNLVKNKGIERQVTSDDKAPKTGDAGLAMETASAGLASGLLLLLKRFKRRKEDEE
ncbi:MAG: G5 domain-containing protein [Peptoniphilus harei]|uniref:G5 domain-containing protein n=2 Tax=Peptoniphilus harei TaxID=54005 RepID=A0A943SNL5_9FIRM|nr:G5 domain-containing protein [Peptoniphilus harei]